MQQNKTMWNSIKTLFNSPTKKEQTRKVTVEELALKEARRILECHIDELAEGFSLIHQPEFETGQVVQVNVFGVGKPGSTYWEGGATTLMKCLEADTEESIQAEITGCRVHKGLAYEAIDWFFGESWSMIVDWVIEDKKGELIHAFDRKLDRVAKDRSYLTPHKCLYLDYHFKTSSKKKPAFEPLWGLSANAFHPLDSKEAKLTRKLHKQHVKLNEARKEIQKIELKIKKLMLRRHSDTGLLKRPGRVIR